LLESLLESFLTSFCAGFIQNTITTSTVFKQAVFGEHLLQVSITRCRQKAKDIAPTERLELSTLRSRYT
jgi:hypothetical protein